MYEISYSDDQFNKKAVDTSFLLLFLPLPFFAFISFFLTSFPTTLFTLPKEGTTAFSCLNVATTLARRTG